MPNEEDDMDKPVTKRELYEVLEIWGGALEARIESRFDTKLDHLEARIETRFDTKLDQWGNRLSAELAQHTNRILEETRSMIRVIDDKYEPRVSKLEATVFAPKRRRATRRRARKL